MKIKKTGIALAAALLLAAGCGKDSSAQYDAGAEALEAGNYAEARTQFEACISAGESLAQAYRGAGIACLRQQDYAQAETYLQQGLEELSSGNKSTRRDILFYLAQAQTQQGKIQEAEASYDQILSDGDNAQAYVLKGRLLLHSGDEAKERTVLNGQSKTAQTMTSTSISSRHTMMSDAMQTARSIWKKRLRSNRGQRRIIISPADQGVRQAHAVPTEQ